MHRRPLGRTGFDVSGISFGAWAIGGSWGVVDDTASLAALHRAVDRGVNFFDTADVYGDGRSERLIARLKQERKSEEIIVATKAGRRLSPHNAAGYNRVNLSAFVDRSLTNLQTDALDLVQLHCPPTEVYQRPEVFGILDELTAAGKIRHYGVSVEKVDEAIAAIKHPNVKTVQIIFNLFRPRPAEVFFPLARQRQVGVIVRVPLASGLLSGKIHRDTTFAADDHRNFNRHGQAFDVGETFSGVEDFDAALQAVNELRRLVPTGQTLAQFALKWILMFDAVSCAIPGAKTIEQVDANAQASDLPPLDASSMREAAKIYDRHIRELVHQKW